MIRRVIVLALLAAAPLAGCGVPESAAHETAAASFSAASRSAALSTGARAEAELGAASAPIAYRVDPAHSQVLFRIVHLGITPITGRFNQVEAEVVFDSANPGASRVSARIPIASLDTNVPARDQHLRSADYFDAAAHPQATFTSRQVRAMGGRRYVVAGDLTLKGITRPLVLDAVYNGRVEMGVDSLPHAGFVATGTIRRSDFRVGGTVRLPGNVNDLADEVQLILELQMVPATARGGSR